MRRWRLEIVTVKSRAQRLQKLTYIVASLPRTDKASPQPYKVTLFGRQLLKIFSLQTGEIGIGPQPAAG
jgi:hypothetical protein